MDMLGIVGGAGSSRSMMLSFGTASIGSPDAVIHVQINESAVLYSPLRIIYIVIAVHKKILRYLLMLGRYYLKLDIGGQCSSRRSSIRVPVICTSVFPSSLRR
jgi:hypothetical protein